MGPEDLAAISREAVYVLIAVSTPILLLSLIVGLIISLFQALTQIQESSLTFVPKILITYISLLFLTPFIYSKLKYLAEYLAEFMINK